MKKILLSVMLASAIGAMAQGGYQDGVDYYNAGRLDEAKIILNNTLNSKLTNQAVSNYYLGLIDLQEGNKDAALQHFNAGREADPADPFNYVGLAQLSLLNGDKKGAGEFFKEAEKLGKKDAAVSAAIARAYYSVDPVLYKNEVSKYIAKGLKDSKNAEPAIYMLQGDMAAATNAGEAAGLYEMAIAQAEGRGDRVSPEAYVKYANTYFRINPKFAINKLVELNEKLDNSALAQRELAEKYYENNQLTMAADQYGKYMRNPNHFQKDEQRYAGLLYFGKKYEESLKVAEKVIAQDPNNFYMWRMKMYNLADLKRYDEALAAGERFFSIPNAEVNYKDYDVYGDILLEMQKYPEAVAAYEKAMALNPEKTDMYEKISAAYTSAEDYKAAAEAMQKYVDAGNDKTNDFYMLARRYFNYAVSQPEDAPERAEIAKQGLVAIDKALEKAPEQGTLWRLKAQLLQVANNGEISPEVAQAYEKMIEAYLAEPDAMTTRKDAIATGYLILANYYLKDGDKATARTNFEKYLEVKPEDEAVREYLKKN